MDNGQLAKALCAAACNKELQVFEYLLKKYQPSSSLLLDDAEHYYFSPAYYIFKRRDPQAVRLLLEYGLENDLDLYQLDPDVFCSIFMYEQVDILKMMIEDFGFKPALYEQKRDVSLLCVAMRYRLLAKENACFDLLIENGANLNQSTLDDSGERVYPLDIALASKTPKLLQWLIDKGANPALLNTVEQPIVHRMLNKGYKFSEQRIAMVVPSDFDYNSRDQYGDTPLLLAAANYSYSAHEIDILLSHGADVNLRSSSGETALMKAIYINDEKIVKSLLDAGADANVVSEQGTALDFAKKHQRSDIVKQLKNAGAATTADLASGSNDRTVLEASFSSLFKVHEPWAAEVLEMLKDWDDETLRAWTAIFSHAAGKSGSRPSARWLKTGQELIDTLGEKSFRETLIYWLSLVAGTVTKVNVDESPEPINFGWFSEYNNLLFKSLVWLCSLFPDSEMARTLRELATTMFKKVPNYGIRNSKLANASLVALSCMEGEMGIKEIATLRAKTKYNAAKVNIDRVFQKLADERGVSMNELAQLAAQDYGLTEVGCYREAIGDFTVTLSMTQVGKTKMLWLKDGTEQKSVPAEIKRSYQKRLTALKSLAKDLQVASSTHAFTLEQMYLNPQEFAAANWKNRFIEHPVIGFLGRKLIWSAKTGEQVQSFIWTEEGYVNEERDRIELGDDALITLWHPATASLQECVAWRDYLVDNEITQPFKQAFREIYLLTDAERETEDHSLRFAGHILNQHIFHALAQQRGWKQYRGGAWDGGSENEACKKLPYHNLEVEFEASGIDDYGSTNIYNCVSTGRLTFFRKDKPVKLNKLDPLLFSEVMRDLDLFVGVASVGNDPSWEFRDQSGYWTTYSFGDLSQSAQTRKDVLEKLVPKLAMAEQLEITGRFLHVKGKLRNYKIHMGSGNILMEPNDSYLCIVPKATATAVFLPFEGDAGLSIILSKAMLLAKDDKIKDASILSQIHGGSQL